MSRQYTRRLQLCYRPQRFPAECADPSSSALIRGCDHDLRLPVWVSLRNSQELSKRFVKSEALFQPIQSKQRASFVLGPASLALHPSSSLTDPTRAGRRTPHHTPSRNRRPHPNPPCRTLSPRTRPPHGHPNSTLENPGAPSSPWPTLRRSRVRMGCPRRRGGSRD